ncbi:unnamed protein product (macronuclear) [Paramecium tetraurelia]|uniref:Transmembrane protein n=1 Tax=Paramecium tetraurelia TaxID=5888 RepID=A0BHZ2_PARTE|nr:uncharacterized protein GSPATT00029195001 [Paramecium tetraurelia]CAK58159.1 unnamed protein product [Paramecium tetraurelia]|eukprot:XP_001425557.1 hypothetical protein (macronuclear) [Paramecium tetraurelia strain d4-2]
MKRIYQIIQQLDIFGQTIALNINKQSSYKTFFGGISSILIIAILIAFFFSNVVDFLNQTDIIFSLETKFSVNPDAMILSQENYMAAFSIEQEGYAINPYFNISIEQRQYVRDESGKQIKSISSVPLEPCTLSHFNVLLKESNLNFEEQYNSLDLSNWLCPKKDFQFKLSGTYSSQEFNFIKIVIKECEQGNENESGWNPVCASEQAKQQSLEINGQFKLQIYQVNSIINPSQSKAYVRAYLDDEICPDKPTYFIENTSFRMIYPSCLFSIQFSSILRNIQQEELIVRQNADYRDLTEIGRDTDDKYAVIYLRRSQFTEIVKRRFTSIGELLSYLGGFLQIMITGLGLFIIYYNKIQMQIELSNKLYNFKINAGDNSKIAKRVIKLSQISNVKVQQQCVDDSQNMNINDSLIDEKQKKNYLKSAIIKQFHEVNKISLSLKLILNQVTFGLMFNNNDSLFLNKAINQVNHDLNIHHILYKIQEIQKLKQVLLRRAQIILFNFTPKPLITLDEEYQLPNRMDFEENLNDLISSKLTDQTDNNLFSNLYQAYLEIKKELEEQSMPFCQFSVNAQLASELGPQMQEIFKRQEMIENQEKAAFSVILKSVSE